MPELKGSKTEKNLEAAFAGESMARNKYTYFAGAAKKEGFEQIAALFETTANNEKEHAKVWFKLFHGIGTTAENLKTAASGEHYEWTEMYANFAADAKAEGFDDIARLFERAAAVEKRHEARYNTLLANIQNNTVFAKGSEQEWECRNCGFIMKGVKAPEKCPLCQHPKPYFEIEAKNY